MRDMCELPHEPDAPPGSSGNAQGDGGRDVGSSEPLRWAVILAASFVISAAIVAAYAFWLAPRPQHFAQVDMEAVLKSRQKDFADLIAKGKGEAAYDLASRMGPSLARAMGELGRECKCVLLVSSAVAGDGLTDLTPRLQQILNAPGGNPTTTEGQPK